MTARVLRRLVAMDFIVTLEYRGAFLIYMIGNIAVPIISLLVWLTVSEQGVALPLDRGQLVTYYLLLSVVSMLTSTWLAEWLGQSIRLGEISPWLLRPARYVLSQVSNNLAEKATKAFFLVPMVLFACLCFRDDLRLPTDTRTWALFALCLPMTATTAFLLDFVIGSLAFWMEDVNGISRVRTLVVGFLSGQVIPLALFPEEFSGVLAVQPFRYILSFPLEVLTGTLGPDALAVGFAWQAGWCTAMWLTYRVLWRYGLRVYA
ncbi:MAG: ABC-2 family transporter protein, partial [Chloroflexota bacterium]|nr:ABC-2 family transporter protein [Chloroflexota bacterium]